MLHRRLTSCLIAAVLAGAPAGLSSCRGDPAVRAARHLKRGKERMEKREFVHAILEFTNATRLAPKDAEAHYQLGVALLEAKRTPQAVQSFRMATQLDPKHAGAQVKLAELMVESRADAVLEDVERRMTALVAEQPDNPDAIRALGIAAFKLRKGAEAEEKLAHGLERFPAHLKTAASLALMRLARRDFEGAEAALKSVTAASPSSTEAGLALAQFYLMIRKLPMAEAEVSRVLGVDAGSVPALLMKAAFEMERGDTAQAEETYRKVSSLPKSGYPHAHAAFLLHHKRFDEAIAEFRRLWEAAPEDREARNRLIQAELAARRTTDAERDLAQALKKNPKDQDALLQRSRLFLAAGRLDDAEKDLWAVLAFSPNSADAHIGLAQVYGASGFDLRAREETAEALRLRPDLLPVRIELSRLFITARAPQSALETLDGAPAPQKASPEFVVARNWTLLGLQRLAEARQATEDALKRRRDPELLFQRALLKLREKDFAGARADGDAVLALNPQHTRALHLTVEARLALKDRAGAEEAVKSAAARQPQSAVLQTAAGELLAGFGKRVEGRRCLEAAVGADPAYAPAALALARLDQGEGRTADARNRLNAILASQPRNILALVSLGDLELVSGNRAQAADFYRRASEVDRRNVLALNNYAYLRAEIDPDGALPLAQKALEMAPESAMVLDTLGWIYFRKGLNDLAVANLEKAMSREPTPRRQFHLGMAQMKVGLSEAAAENIAAALKKDARLSTTEVWR